MQKSFAFQKGPQHEKKPFFHPVNISSVAHWLSWPHDILLCVLMYHSILLKSGNFGWNGKRWNGK